MSGLEPYSALIEISSHWPARRPRQTPAALLRSPVIARCSPSAPPSCSANSPSSSPHRRPRLRGPPRSTGVTLIPVAKLDFAEAQDDYVALASQGKKHLKQQTITSLEASLDPSRFVHIHRSYIVNLERVTKIELYAKDSRIAILADGTQLPVSRGGHARLKALLDQRS